MSKTRQRKQSTYNEGNEGVTDRKQGKKPFKNKYREYDELNMNGYKVNQKDAIEKLPFIDEQEQIQNN